MKRNNLVVAVVMGIAGICCPPFNLIAAIWGVVAILAAKRMSGGLLVLRIGFVDCSPQTGSCASVNSITDFIGAAR